MNQNDIDQAEAIMQAVARVVKDATAAMAIENAELRREVAALKTVIDALAESHATTSGALKEMSERAAPVEIDLTCLTTRVDFEQAQEKTAEVLGYVKDAIQTASKFAQDQAELNDDYTSAIKRFDEVAKGLTSDIHAVPALVQETVKSAVAALPPIEIPKAPEVRDGRDAVQIDILPAIDTAKSYPRGSYARHAGGVWKAYRDTDGMHGWECVLRGVKSLAVTMADERTLTVTTELSDGEPSIQTIAIPTVLDRGPYVEGKTYEPGDAVTYGGSLWIAQKSSPTGRPGDEGSEGWRLAVRRGRDATKQPVKV